MKNETEWHRFRGLFVSMEDGEAGIIEAKELFDEYLNDVRQKVWREARIEVLSESTGGVISPVLFRDRVYNRLRVRAGV